MHILTKLTRFVPLSLITISLVVAPLQLQAEGTPVPDLTDSIRRIDERMPGNLGVYIKDLSNGEELEYVSDRNWYLASTTKIPLAIAIYQRVEDGEFPLTHELELSASDYVDGAGQLLSAQPGTRYTLDELIEHSITDSDSTATDMLIRFLGQDELNEQIQKRIVKGLEPITTILQVRYDAYSEVHRGVKDLSNIDIMDVRGESTHDKRFATLLDKLNLKTSDTPVSSVGDAFEKYYQRGPNSGNLVAMGAMLERLVEGELINASHTRRLLGYMENITTGDARIKAGLPENAVFAQKTGTQIARSCNVGILNSHEPEEAVVVAACAEQYDHLGQAEQAFASLGAALTGAGLVRE